MPFLHVTCPSCSTILKVPPEAAGKRVRCSTCKNVMSVPAEESCEEPAVNYVADFRDEPPPVRYRPEPVNEESPQPTKRSRPAPPPASLRFPVMVLSVATLWLLVVVVLWFVLETPSADVASQIVAAPTPVARVADRLPPAGNFVEAMREFGQRMDAEAKARNAPVDWSRVGPTARVEDLVFTITSTSLIRQGLAAVPDELIVSIRIDNHSKTKIYRVTKWETKSLTDEHGNQYRNVGGSWPMWHVKVIPGGSTDWAVTYEYPEEVSRRFRLTFHGDSFELSSNVHLAFDRPTTLIDHSAKRRE